MANAVEAVRRREIVRRAAELYNARDRKLRHDDYNYYRRHYVKTLREKRSGFKGPLEGVLTIVQQQL